MTEPRPAQAEDRVVILGSGHDGGDPLVADYLDLHRGTCAFTVLSWSWLLLGAVATMAGGLLGNRFGPPPADLPPGADALVIWLHQNLGNMLPVTIGMIAGGCWAAFLARFIHRPGVPATHEPLISMPLIVVAYLVLRDPLIGLAVGAGGLCLIYLLVMLFRLLALVLGMFLDGERSVRLPEPPGGWPVYTVLVPLYRETAVAEKILKHLHELDYPRDRLDVKLLLEADDPDTLMALQRAGIPAWAEAVVVPHDQPKTKPRACNHGLARARGQYLVIFDAEDRPEPDQLKQAVTIYREYDRQRLAPDPWWRRLPRLLLFWQPRRAEVACLQAHLAYHNYSQNLLTRWFALEYNVWFQRWLGGLRALGGPIPLGGTSNHFRTEVLHQLGGWDPFNVTEDCDLGIRLHLAGYRTAILDSVTWEEANSKVGNWLRQRSRWLKGYMITHLVWLRRPVQLLRGLGPWGFFCFFAAIFGVAGLAVFNLVLWTALGLYACMLIHDMGNGYGLGELLWSQAGSLNALNSGELLATRPDRLSLPMVIEGPGEDPLWFALSRSLFVASVTLFFANFLFVLINMVFGRRPGQRGLWFAGLISPLYWVLISLGAWKGLWQLLLRPHYWEKTVHGLDTPIAPPPANE